MAEAIEELIRKLEPLIGKNKSKQYLQEYNDGKFSPTLRKSVEREIKELAYQFDLDNQITIYPVPKRSVVVGE